MTLNAIIANFQTFKLVDLLDIIIIAFLIYQLLGIVNRTRAGQLFKGALLVMAVYLVAETLNMRTVTWLLNEKEGDTEKAIRQLKEDLKQ